MTSSIFIKSGTESGTLPAVSTLSLGELAINVGDGGLYYENVTSSLVELIRAGSSSIAETASFALTAGGVAGNSSGAFTGTFTGAFLGTSSWALNSISSSHAVTAAFALNAGGGGGGGGVFGGDFSGSFSGSLTGALAATGTLTGTFLGEFVETLDAVTLVSDSSNWRQKTEVTGVGLILSQSFNGLVFKDSFNRANATSESLGNDWVQETDALDGTQIFENELLQTGNGATTVIVLRNSASLIDDTGEATPAVPTDWIVQANAKLGASNTFPRIMMHKNPSGSDGGSDTYDFGMNPTSNQFELRDIVNGGLDQATQTSAQNIDIGDVFTLRMVGESDGPTSYALR